MRLPSVNPSVAIGNAVAATNSANEMIDSIFAIQAVMRKENELVKNTPNARKEQRLWRECILFLTSALQFCRVAEVQTRVFTNPEAESLHPPGLVNMARNISRFACRSIAALKLKRAVAYYAAGMYTLATGDLDSIDFYRNEVTADIVVAARIVYALVEVASGAPDEEFKIEDSLLETAESIAKGSISAAKAIMGFVNLEGVALKELRKTSGEASTGTLREGFRVEFPCIFPTKLDFDVEKHILGLLNGSNEVQATMEVMKRHTAPIDVVRITSLRRDELKLMPVCTPEAPLVAGRLIYIPTNQQDTPQVSTGYVVPPPFDRDECARHIQHELEALCQASGIPTDLIELRYEGVGKGYGMFAKKDLSAGTVVLKERPIFGMSMSPTCCQVCLRSTKNSRVRCRNYHAASEMSSVTEVDCENVAYCSERCRAFDEVFHRTAFSCGIQSILPEKRTSKQSEILRTTSPGRQMMTRMQTDASLIPYMIIRIILRLRQREQENMIMRGIEHPASAVLSGQGTHPAIDIFDLCPDLAVLSSSLPLQLAVTTPFVSVFRNAYRLLTTAQNQHISSKLSADERSAVASLERPTSAGSSSSRDRPEADEVAPLPIVPGKEEEIASLPLPIHNIFATENLDLRTYMHLHGIIRTNTFASPEGALELFTIISMFNHSCNPNAERVIFQYHDDRDNLDPELEEKTLEVIGARKNNYKTEDVYVDEMPTEAKEAPKGTTTTTTPAKENLVSSSAAIADGPISGIRLKRPVKAGEEVFISYIDSKGRSVYERRTMLSGYGFKCNCHKCARELEGIE